MDTLYTAFRVLPIAAEFLFAAHRLLPFAQSSCMPLETVEWDVKAAIRERGKARHAQVNADRAATRHGLLNLSLGLNAHEPLAARETDGDVLDRAEHLAAIAVAQPFELGQEQARVHLIELDLFRVGITEAIVPSLLFE